MKRQPRPQPGQILNSREVLGVPFRALKKLHCVCRCTKCGKISIVQIQKGTVDGCQCSGSRSTIGNRVRTHGECTSPIYALWARMKRRCSDKRNPWYGGRGIAVCEEWRDNYQAFKDFALKNGYDPGKQIDRIDVNGNYEPGNIRFVTHKENCQNRRSCRQYKCKQL